jgi:hypothetical protein
MILRQAAGEILDPIGQWDHPPIHIVPRPRRCNGLRLFYLDLRSSYVAL